MARPITGYLEPTASEFIIRVRTKHPITGDKVDEPIHTGTLDEGLAKQLQPVLVKKFLESLGMPAQANGQKYEPVLTLGDYAVEFFKRREAARVLTWEDEERWWRVFCKRHLAEYQPGNVSRTKIEDVYIEALKQGTSKKIDGKWVTKDLSLESLKKIKGVLFRLFDYLDGADLIHRNPVPKAKLPSLADDHREREQLTDEEFLIYASWPSTLAWSKAENLQRERDGLPLLVDAEIQTMSILARTVGAMRTSDLHALKWERLLWDSWTLQVVRPKTRKKKTPKAEPFVVPEEVRPFILRWWEATGRHTKGPIFPSRGRRAGVSQDVSKAERKAKTGGSYAHRFRRDLLACGLNRHELHHETDDSLPVDFHSWRRANATSAALAGLHGRAGQEQTGHATPEMFELYVSKRILNQRPVIVPDAMNPFTKTSASKPEPILQDVAGKTVLPSESSIVLDGSQSFLSDASGKTILMTSLGPLEIEVDPTSYWSGWQDLNLQQPAPKAGPLPG